MSSSNEPTGTRPKPLRVPANQISGADCVAAFATRNSILKKDAIHTPPTPEPPTIDSTTHQLGDLLLDKSHLIIQALDSHLKELLIKANVPGPPTKIAQRQIPGMTKCGNTCTACPYIREGKISKSQTSPHGI